MISSLLIISNDLTFMIRIHIHDCLINIFFNNYLVWNQNRNKANTLHLLDVSIKPHDEFWSSWWNFHGLGVGVGREMDKSKRARHVPAGWKSENRGLQCFPAVLWNTLGLSWWPENPASRASEWHRWLSRWWLLLHRDTAAQRTICSMALILINSESNESERERILMLETGYLDFSPNPRSETLSLWTFLHICHMAMVISPVLRPTHDVRQISLRSIKMCCPM